MQRRGDYGQKKNSAAIESDESIVENTSSNVINDNHIEFVEIIRNEIYINSDSSSSGEFVPAVYK